VHVAVGYVTPVDLVAKLTRDYPLVREINIMGPPMSYFVQLRDQARPDVKLNTGIANLLLSLPLGANGCLCAEPNIIPKVCRAVVDHWVKGDQQAAGEALTNVIRFGNIVNQWAPSTARWIKMALKILDLPGGNGVVREPYLLPGEADQKKMADQFAAMGLKELEGLP
jgi:dihydrodipicolinate synthase/N-acetylneuraminate lyase